MQQIWLIRHGETAWSRSGQHTGWTDIPLLAESAVSLKALRPHVQNHAFALVLSSPLQRAYQTAKLVGFESPETDDNLREWNYGRYEGKTKEEIRQLAPEWTLWTDGVPDGETLSDVAQRAQNVLRRARAVPGDVALIAHGHILRIIAACWLELPPVNAEHFALSTGSVSVLSYENELSVLAQWNWRPDDSTNAPSNKKPNGGGRHHRGYSPRTQV
jgi:probable phosphoglycerate mutase